jgi:hypothetical protein
MQFRAEPDSNLGQAPARGSPWLLFMSVALVVVAGTRPWIRVQFERLFGELHGPPGWQSQAGFTCFCSAMLIAVMTLAESSTTTTQRAVRPASLLLAVLSALTLGYEWLQGPGQLRGVSARWTWAFWLTAAVMTVLVASCGRRWSQLPPHGAR